MPYSNFRLTAEVLDQRRLGKQRVECLQILQTLKKGPYICNNRGKSVRTPWYNHPTVQMWKGYEAGLLLYMQEICSEWSRRGYKDTCWKKAQHLGYRRKNIFLPDWLGNERFHLSHQSNLLRKYPEHYSQFFIGIPDDLPYVWPIK